MPMYITKAGQALEANAKLYGRTLTLTHFVVGDGDLPSSITDIEAMTELISQVDQVPVNRLAIDETNSNWLIVEGIIAAESGPYDVAEVGILADDGTLYAVGSYPRTVKPQADSTTWGKELYIKATIATSNANLVTLKVDNTLVAATRSFVIDVIGEHASSRNHPAATTTELGFVEKATPTEAKSGTADKFPDSAGMKAALDDRIADQATVDAGEDNTKFVTSLTLSTRLKNAAVWTSKAPGEVFVLRDDQPGVEPPPTDNPAYRYIKLTAGESGPGGYNEGILINETVDGSSPHITATAEINAPGHDRHGEIVELINTDRRVIRAGEAGTLQDDALQQMTGTLGRYFQTSTSSGGNAGSGVLRYNHVAWGGSTGGASQGTITFNASYAARTASETRVRSIGGTYYERVF